LVEILKDEERGVDMNDLAQQLEKYKEHKLRIGSFSAASNITGRLFDTDSIASLLHKHGALAFFDYATAAPYVIFFFPNQKKTLFKKKI
jgi:selenocysteine lyase/cysteine desulfurase